MHVNNRECSFAEEVRKSAIDTEKWEEDQRSNGFIRVVITIRKERANGVRKTSFSDKFTFI